MKPIRYWAVVVLKPNADPYVYAPFMSLRDAKDFMDENLKGHDCRAVCTYNPMNNRDNDDKL